LRVYVQECQENRAVPTPQDSFNFKQQVVQAIEDLKVEMAFERDNLRKIATQIQDLFDQLDMQKQRLQQWIDESKTSDQSRLAPLNNQEEAQENTN
jgi:cell division FtsZ-interacting protein ZapD